jgi:hypothetical protein
MINEGTAGHPQPPDSVGAFSCQYRNAKIIPIAPCAKLKIPDVVYVTTRPAAAIP